MRIRHFSFSETGGAGRVATTLASEQRQLGDESSLVSMMSSNLREQPWAFPGLTVRAAVDDYVVKSAENSTLISFARDGYRSNVASPGSDTDIVNLHWINGMLNLDQLDTIVNRRHGATLWTLHDMAPFTAVCHQAQDCSRFQAECSQCPQARRIFQRRVAARFVEKREHKKTLTSITYVAPSTWIRNQAISSSLLKDAEIVEIANPINQVFFGPSQRVSVRRHRGYTEQSLVVAVVANDLADPLKQVGQTISALARVRASGVALELLLIGANGGALAKDLPWVRYCGRLTELGLIAELAAADFLIMMSLAETAPLVVAEAAALGIPTIVRRGIGATAMVEDHVLGLHVDDFDQLSALLVGVVGKKGGWDRMSAQAAEHAARTYEPRVVARKYLELYSEKLKG